MHTSISLLSIRAEKAKYLLLLSRIPDGSGRFRTRKGAHRILAGFSSDLSERRSRRSTLIRLISNRTGSARHRRPIATRHEIAGRSASQHVAESWRTRIRNTSKEIHIAYLSERSNVGRYIWANVSGLTIRCVKLIPVPGGGGGGRICCKYGARSMAETKTVLEPTVAPTPHKKFTYVLQIELLDPRHLKKINSVLSPRYTPPFPYPLAISLP